MGAEQSYREGVSVVWKQQKYPTDSSCMPGSRKTGLLLFFCFYSWLFPLWVKLNMLGCFSLLSSEHRCNGKFQANYTVGENEFGCDAKCDWELFKYVMLELLVFLHPHTTRHSTLGPFPPLSVAPLTEKPGTVWYNHMWICMPLIHQMTCEIHAKPHTCALHGGNMLQNLSPCKFMCFFSVSLFVFPLWIVTWG